MNAGLALQKIKSKVAMSVDDTLSLLQFIARQFC